MTRVAVCLMVVGLVPKVHGIANTLKPLTCYPQTATFLQREVKKNSKSMMHALCPLQYTRKGTVQSNAEL